MSLILMAKAMNIRVGHPIRKLVLLKLADNANDRGECWPSNRHIAEHCECSKSTARAHIDELAKMGLLVKRNRIGKNNGKGNTSNFYTLHLDTPMPGGSIPPMPAADIGVPCVDTPMPGGGTPYAATRHPLCRDTAPEPVIEPVIESVKEPKGNCQADELPDDFDSPDLQVLKHMNRVTGAQFQDGKTTMGFINGLLSGEYVADELILVVDYLADLWTGDTKMEQYLRPSTMFDFENFEGYLPLARKWDSEGRKPLNSKPVEINTTERDQAYRRFIGGVILGTRGALEIAVRKSAAQAGIKNLSSDAGKRAWDRIWSECASSIHVSN